MSLSPFRTMRGSRFAFELILLLASILELGSASRDEGSRIVEVAAQNHFVQAKTVESHTEAGGSKSMSAEVQKHEQATHNTSQWSDLSGFSRQAMQALTNGNDPSLSHQQKTDSVQAALDKATHVMEAMASRLDPKKSPELALKVARKLAHLKSMTSPSLLQEQEDAAQKLSAGTTPSKTATITSEMRKELAAFGKAAVQALVNGGDAAMTYEEKTKSMQAALARAANAVTSVASLVDSKNSPELANHLANLNEMTGQSLIQMQQQEAHPPSGTRLTPEVREQVKAFSEAAVQALANSRNPDMSSEEKAKHVHGALAQAANSLESVASLADTSKNPKLAKKLAQLKKLLTE